MYCINSFFVQYCSLSLLVQSSALCFEVVLLLLLLLLLLKLVVRVRSPSDLYMWCYFILSLPLQSHMHYLLRLCCLFYCTVHIIDCHSCGTSAFASVWVCSLLVLMIQNLRLRLKVVIQSANVFKLCMYVSLFLWFQQQQTKVEATIGQKASLVVNPFLEVTQRFLTVDHPLCLLASNQWTVVFLKEHPPQQQHELTAVISLNLSYTYVFDQKSFIKIRLCCVFSIVSTKNPFIPKKNKFPLYKPSKW